ncbi:MAG TPA: YggT family protein [Gaiellaceae bacterium]|jgi:YggT family protein|nr:YggT family protein [Gaiellaceae bacterium]
MVLDVVGAVQTFIYIFATVYLLALLLYVLTSWVQLPYSLRGVQRFLSDACEPYLRFWRRLLPLSFGAIDFSPIVAIAALLLVARILIAILNAF